MIVLKNLPGRILLQILHPDKKEMELLLELRQKIIKNVSDGGEIHKRAFLECRKMIGLYMEN